MSRRLVTAAALFLAAVAGDVARANEPACIAFQADLDHALATAPDTLQLSNLLFEAARKGCQDALVQILGAGASRLSRNREGDTALAVAARAGRKPVVDILLKGATAEERRQIDMPDARGSTPLMLAIHAGRSAVAKDLLAAGAAVEPVNAMGETALSEAAFAGDDEVADLLLKKGAKADTVDRYGKSPLCYAAARGRARLVGALLDAGLDPNARFGNNLTALMWAAGFPDLTPIDDAVTTVRALIARGAKIDLVDDRGRSALGIAAALNRFETVKVLLEAGANRDLRDKQGQRAVDLAATDEMRAMLQ